MSRARLLVESVSLPNWQVMDKSTKKEAHSFHAASEDEARTKFERWLKHQINKGNYKLRKATL